MKSLFKLLVAFLAFNIGGAIMPQKALAQEGFVSFQLFYDDLSPYGSWVEYPNYGYVWIPDEDPGFSPYATSGHWLFTDDGWMWVSDYPWGWATFHYGRWDYDENYGWFWVPDNEWGPAWVSWRSSPGYYGWAPLRPGISLSFAFGADYHERNERWNFVRDRDIMDPDISHRYVDRSNNVTIIKNSTVIVNTRQDNGRSATYIAGPGRDDVQRVTRTTVRSATIRESNQPGQRQSNGELQIYRPQVQRRNAGAQNPAPSRVIKLQDLKPASERTSGRRQEQPQKVTIPERGQQPQQRLESRPPNRAQQQQQDVKPVNRDQQRQKRDVQPPNRGQQQQAREVKPPNDKGTQKQPEKVVAPRKIQKAQPTQTKSTKDEKNKKDKKDQGSQE